MHEITAELRGIQDGSCAWEGVLGLTKENDRAGKSPTIADWGKERSPAPAGIESASRGKFQRKEIRWSKL